MSAVAEWADDLDRLADTIVDEARPVMSKGALNVKTQWRQLWSHHPRIRHLPWQITYDLGSDETDAWAVIGPVSDPGTQGPLGNIIEDGTLHSAPIPGGRPAMDAEAPRLERALADLGEKILAGKR